MLDDYTDTALVKPRSNRKKIIVPMLNDGAQLQAWATSHDLPDAPVGGNTQQYYQLLCNALERKQQRKGM